MRILKVLLTYSTIALLSISEHTLAFDDKKQGFILDFGIGGASSQGNYSRESGLATSFKIGYAPQDNIQLFYIRNATWMTLQDGLFVEGISALGGAYSFNSAMSVFAGAGVSDFSELGSAEEATTGNGKLFGLSYEFSPHNNIQLVQLQLDFDLDFGYSYSTTATQLLYTYSFY